MTALQLTVSTHDGRVVAHGHPSEAIGQGGTFEVLTFAVDHPLPADRAPYTVSARWRTAPDLSSFSRLSITAVPDDAGTRLGDRFIEAGIGAPYYAATIFRLVRNAVDRHGRQRTFVSETNPEKTFTSSGDDDTRGLGPMIADAGVESLRRTFVGRAVQTNNYAFGCVNALSEGARVELLPGKSMHIDTIARAAHVMQWLPDDPRAPIHTYPCNGDCSKDDGTFVDSPLVVGFRIDPDSVRVIPGIVRRPFTFHGNCTRGFAVLQNERQFSDLFTLTVPSP